MNLIPGPGLSNPEPTNPEPVSFEAQPAESPYAGPAPILRVRVRSIPNLVDTLIFFLLTAVVLVASGGVFVGALQDVHLLHQSDLANLATDARLFIPIQAAQYLLLVLAAMAIFSTLWDRPFWKSIHWNAAFTVRRLMLLPLLGVLLGVMLVFVGNLLPMPKDAPIIQDMTRSPTSAWLIFIFGVTAAPITEELAYRGFLLPSLMNAFAWLHRERIISTDPGSTLAVGVSILVTTIPFTLMHGPQINYAWGPLLLIAIVSAALCIVRLRLDSLAASTLVHASYNATLFLGSLAATGGFRHLDKLNG